MEFDIMTRADSWENIASLARDTEEAGASGLLFTEASQVPWMMIATAAQAAPNLHHSTGISVAFPRSPMVSAQIAWELAANTKGKFRLGLGSQVKPHIERRYGVAFDQPAKRMRSARFAARSGWRMTVSFTN
jgi:alkanesulfonate monooxygenase SsuD/methylene tetrahydromethanopterin reductase-like flavin-dependent oxidoreductase (luciferase family)